MNLQEFFKRWGEGIQKVTPLQQIKVTMLGSVIILLGIIAGVFTSLAYKQWWLVIILVGSFIVQGLGLLGSIQKYLALSKIDKMMKDIQISTKEVDL